jgi:hypothetical protein
MIKHLYENDKISKYELKQQSMQRKQMKDKLLQVVKVSQ